MDLHLLGTITLLEVLTAAKVRDTHPAQALTRRMPNSLESVKLACFVG